MSSQDDQNMKQIEEALARLEIDMKRVQRESDTLEDNLRRMDSDLARHDREVESAKRKFEEAEKNHTKLTVDRDAFKKKHDETAQRLNAYHTKLEEMERSIADFRAKRR